MMLWILLWAKIATAGCSGLQLSFGNTTVDLSTDTAPAISFNVQRWGNGSCNYFVTVDYGGAAVYSDRRLVRSGGYTIPANFYRDASHTQILKKIPDATLSTDVLAGTFPGGYTPSANTHTFYPMLGSVSYNRFGTYTDTFTFRLYEGVPGSSSLYPSDSQSLTLKYTMARKIDLALVPSGAPFNAADTTETLNFGNLTAGTVRTFDIALKFNAGYRVKISSANNGRLKHVSQTDTVPYTLLVNSAAVNLVGSSTTPVEVSTGTGVSPTNGLSLPASVTIGALGQARAGNYSDTITVTVSTSE